MKTEVKEVESTKRELKITIPADRALNDYQTTLQNFKRFVQIPGFRKGKAPLSMIERTYGDYAKEEFFNEHINDYYKEALEKDDLHPVNQGELSDVIWDKGNELVATFHYEVMPEIKIEKYKNLEIPFEPIEFKPEMIDKALKEHQAEMGVINEAETVKEKDKVEIELHFLDDEGTITKTVNRTFQAGSENIYCEQFNQNVLGKKAGDTFDTILFDKAAAQVPEDFGEKVIGRKFRVTIQFIEREEFPDIDDDFAKDFDYENLEEMKEHIEEEYKEKIEKENNDRIRGAILEKVIAENPFDLPKSVVQEYARNLAKPYAEAYKMEIDELLPMYFQIADFHLKSYFIVSEIQKIENIDISEEDQEAQIKENAKKLNMDAEKYKRLYKNRIDSEEFKDSIIEEKVIQFIKNTSTYVPYPKENENDSEEKLDKTVDSE